MIEAVRKRPPAPVSFCRWVACRHSLLRMAGPLISLITLAGIWFLIRSALRSQPGGRRPLRWNDLRPSELHSWSDGTAHIPIHVGPIQSRLSPGRLLFWYAQPMSEGAVLSIGIGLGIVVPIGAIILLLILRRRADWRLVNKSRRSVDAGGHRAWPSWP